MSRKSSTAPVKVKLSTAQLQQNLEKQDDLITQLQIRISRIRSRISSKQMAWIEKSYREMNCVPLGAEFYLFFKNEQFKSI